MTADPLQPAPGIALPSDLAAPFALFAASDGTAGRDALLFRNPAEIIVAERPEDVVEALSRVERATERGMHAAGFVSYDAAPAFDPALAVRPGGTLPLVWFGVFGEPEKITLRHSGELPFAEWRHAISRDEYDAALGQIHGAIGRGAVYQVNYTLRLCGEVTTDPVALFQRLWAAQETALAAYFDIGGHRVLSVSPELFFLRSGRRIVTRPMKGTLPRGRWMAEDDALATALATSEKDCAENVMIVDLVRNDLGRIAVTGSVRVNRLFDVERYPTVLQMTSTISADLVAGTTLADIFVALFPCGSVTGAPKVAAMQMISALETSPRGVYCGAVGRIRPSGDATFSVAIRTATIESATGAAEYSVGGGITWDSVAAAEYDEVRAKAAVLSTDRPEFSLLETMRLDGREYVRLEAHLARLQESARYFGFKGIGRARPALLAHALEHANCPGARRVRLLHDRDGGVHVESTPIDPGASHGLRVTLAQTPVSRNDVFLYHKTTHRAVYERHRAECPDFDDVILWNEDGELTEFTIGNVVVELAGVRYTPPRGSGLLAGTFRGELVGAGAITERVLRRSDLDAATGVWLVNSVRGWVPVDFRPAR